MTCRLAPDAYQFDDMDARPGYHKKTPTIRHPVHLNGMIYRFYVKPNREVVWKINCLNGHGSPQRYKMNKAVDVVAAVERYEFLLGECLLFTAVPFDPCTAICPITCSSVRSMKHSRRTNSTSYHMNITV
jgi:hypothetical protein